MNPTIKGIIAILTALLLWMIDSNKKRIKNEKNINTDSIGNSDGCSP